MGMVFTLLSLWYTWISIQTLRRFWQQRATLFDENLTASDRAALDRGAFFLLIPLGVLLHELGHAAATWQVGGQVAVFRWYVFWGYIIPRGSFSALQDWWISLAGNAVSVLLGLVAIAAVWLVRGRAWRYWMLAFGRLQLFYGLIFYPAFSLLAGFGDWPQIYGSLLGRADLPTGAASLRPWAIGTLVVHAAFLAVWWAAERTPAVRRALLARYAPAALAERMQRITQVGDVDSMNALAVEYARLGEIKLAEAAFRDAVSAFPDHAAPFLNWARFERGRGRQDRALDLYGEGLARAGEPHLRAIALEGMANAELEHGRPRLSLPHLDQALALRPTDPGLRLLRAQVRWRVDDAAGAAHDLAAAEASGAASGEERVLRAVASLRTEMGLAADGAG